MARTPLVPAVLVLLFGLSSCGGSDSPTDNSIECSGGPPLGLGSTVSGRLESGDALDVDGAYLDRYSLAISRGATVRITMRSAAVDSWLWLRSSGGGAAITSDDDSGGGLDAQFTETLSRGCYLVEATSLGDGQTGNYTLIAESL
jgi:hypothetical protein